MNDLFLFGQVKDLKNIGGPVYFHVGNDIGLLVREMIDQFGNITDVLMIQIFPGSRFITAFKQVFKMIDNISA